MKNRDSGIHAKKKMYDKNLFILFRLAGMYNMYEIL